MSLSILNHFITTVISIWWAKQVAYGNVRELKEACLFISVFFICKKIKFLYARKFISVFFICTYYVMNPISITEKKWPVYWVNLLD